MSTQTADSATSIRPFTVNFPEDALADLRRRIAATRWPTTELVADRTQGVQLSKDCPRATHSEPDSH